MLFIAGLDDYVADVEHVAGELDAAPILSAIRWRRDLRADDGNAADSRRRVACARAAFRLLSVAARLRRIRLCVAFRRLDPMRLSDDILKALRPFYFSDRVHRPFSGALFHSRRIAARMFDLALRLLGAATPSPVFVMGRGDQISTPDDTRAREHHKSKRRSCRAWGT